MLVSSPVGHEIGELGCISAIMHVSPGFCCTVFGLLDRKKIIQWTISNSSEHKLFYLETKTTNLFRPMLKIQNV